MLRRVTQLGQEGRGTPLSASLQRERCCLLTKAESEDGDCAIGRHGPVQAAGLHDQPQLEFTLQSVLCVEWPGLSDGYILLLFNLRRLWLLSRVEMLDMRT